MRSRWFTLLLPPVADNRVRGMKLPAALFAVLAVVSTVRSCIHLFAPDGGAGGIAGMDLSVTSADGIVFAFALWGSAQLVYAVVQLAVAFRYRSLVPLMYVLLVFEVVLRISVGRMRPVTFAHTPPGAWGNYLMLPLGVAMLVLSLTTGMRAQQTPM